MVGGISVLGRGADGLEPLAPEAPPCPLQNNSSRHHVTPTPPLVGAPAGSEKWEWFGAALERARFEGTFVEDPLSCIPADAPKSVWACMLGAWSMVLVDRQTGEVSANRFRCGSWRCPECRYDVAKGDYARILDALEGRTGHARSWVLLTLTFDPRRYASKWDAYRAAGRCWQNLRYRLGRRLGSATVPAKLAYVAVWERHASGWPHVHMAVSCPELVAEINRYGQGRHRLEARTGKLVPTWRWKREVLDDLAVECGFGIVSDVQFPRASEGGVAGYFAKLSAELVGVFDQRPIEAPKGFRRLRASQKLLPPRHQPSGRYLGRLEQQPCCHVTKRLETCRLPVPGDSTPSWPPPILPLQPGSGGLPHQARDGPAP